MREPTDHQRKTRRRWIVAAIGCAIVLLVYPFGWRIAAALWHVAHPRSYHFAGYEITVPLQFVVRPIDNGIILLRLKPAFAWPPWHGEAIEITGHQGMLDIKRWRSASPSAFNANGFTNSTAVDLQFAGSPIRCVQSSSSDFEASLFCVSDSGLDLQYFGGKRGISDFRNFLEVDVRPAGS